MKCLTIQHENVNTGHAATTIATHVQNGIPFHGHKPGDVVSISHRLIDNCLLYARPDCTQTLLQLAFQKCQN